MPGEDRGDNPSHQPCRLGAEIGSEAVLQRVEAMVQGFEPVVQCVEVERERLVRHQVAPATGRPVHEDRGSFDPVGLFELTAQSCSGLIDGHESLPNDRVRQGAVAADSEPAASVSLGYDGKPVFAGGVT